MTTFKITDQLIEKIKQLIEQKKNKELTTLLTDLHYADIAEIIHELDIEEEFTSSASSMLKKHPMYLLN